MLVFNQKSCRIAAKKWHWILKFPNLLIAVVLRFKYSIFRFDKNTLYFVYCTQLMIKLHKIANIFRAVMRCSWILAERIVCSKNLFLHDRCELTEQIIHVLIASYVFVRIQCIFITVLLCKCARKFIIIYLHVLIIQQQ